MKTCDSLQHAFGIVLRNARQAASLSQEALAHQAGLDRTYISLLERGHRQPTLCSLFRIAAVLNTPAQDLVANTEKEMTCTLNATGNL